MHGYTTAARRRETGPGERPRAAGEERPRRAGVGLVIGVLVGEVDARGDRQDQEQADGERGGIELGAPRPCQADAEEGHDLEQQELAGPRHQGHCAGGRRWFGLDGR